MKSYILFLVLAAFYLSCSFNGDNDGDTQDQKTFAEGCLPAWYLVSVQPSMVPGPAVTGEDLEWQQVYILNEADHTFNKKRERDGVVTDAHGTYTYVMENERKYIQFKFDEDSPLIESCTTQARTELHSLNAAEDEFYNVWIACDGSHLIHKKEVRGCL